MEKASKFAVGDYSRSSRIVINTANGQILFEKIKDHHTATSHDKIHMHNKEGLMQKLTQNAYAKVQATN